MFVGGNLSKKARIEISPKCFWPNWSFVKLIPGHEAFVYFPVQIPSPVQRLLPRVSQHPVGPLLEGVAQGPLAAVPPAADDQRREGAQLLPGDYPAKSYKYL
jgi:hypothetical protein